MKLAILFSSGKDSTFTLFYYLSQAWDVKCLLSIIPATDESYMFQTPDSKLLNAQAKSLGFPLIIQESKAEKEIELDDLKLLIQKGIKEHGIKGVAVGALASDYQHERVNRVCEQLNIKVFCPLWHKDQYLVMNEMITAGFDVRMTKIAAEGLNKRWLGKKITTEDMNKLLALNKKIGFHTAGEGGEFETIVLDGPIFKKPISIEYDVEMETEISGRLKIKKVN